MAGVTDLAYRMICREYDSDVMLATEMLSSKSLSYAYQNKKQFDHSRRMEIPEDDNLTGVQLFGHEPDVMSDAAKIATDSGAKFIDINMGCPVAKIVNGMDGAALMREPELAMDIVRSVIKSTHLPVTVKTRLGWCQQSLNAPEFCKGLADQGIKALTIHGRTRSQKYAGSANWELIAKVVEAVDIPVFANGDIKTVHDARNALEISGAAGLAIARGTMGKPWFSKQVNHFIRTGEEIPEPDFNEKLDLAIKHCKTLIEIKGEYIGIQESRRHINNYTSGMYGAAELRKKVNIAENFEQAVEAIEELRVKLSARGDCFATLAMTHTTSN